MYFAGVADQFAGQVFLGHDLGVAFQVCGAGYVLGQLRDVERSADHLEGAVLLQLIHDGEHIDWLLPCGQVDDGFVDELVRFGVKALRLECFVDSEEGVLLEHECTEHSVFQFTRLRLQSARV